MDIESLVSMKHCTSIAEKHAGQAALQCPAILAAQVGDPILPLFFYCFFIKTEYNIICKINSAKDNICRIDEKERSGTS